MEFTKTTTLMAAPAQCRLCGSASKPWYLDLGYSEEFYGAIVYCSDCIGHMATVCGFTTPAEKVLYEQAIEERDKKLYEQRLALDGYREIERGLNKLGVFLNRSDDVPAPGGDDVAVPSLVAVGAGGASAGEDPVGSGAGTSAESSDDAEVDGLHHDDEQYGDSDAGFRLNL